MYDGQPTEAVNKAKKEECGGRKRGQSKVGWVWGSEKSAKQKITHLWAMDKTTEI